MNNTLKRGGKFFIPLVLALIFLFCFIPLAHADISNSNLTQQSININPYIDNTGENSFFKGNTQFNNIGTIAFTSSLSGNISAYVLSNPYDLSALSFSNSVNFTIPGYVLTSFTFSQNGSYLYTALTNVPGGYQAGFSGNPIIQEWFMPMAYNISNATEIGVTTMPQSIVTGLFIDYSGNHLVTADRNLNTYPSGNSYLYTWNLSIPFNIGTISLSTQSSNFPTWNSMSQVINFPKDVYLSNDGKSLYISSGKFQYTQYNLFNPWDVSSSSLDFISNYNSSFYNPGSQAGAGIYLWSDLSGTYYLTYGADGSGTYFSKYIFSPLLNVSGSYQYPSTFNSTSANDFISNLINPVLSIFPPASSLSFAQQMGIVLVIMLFTALLILYAGAGLREGIHDLILWIVVIVLAVEFLYFVAIQYIPVTWVIIILIIGIVAGYFKFKGNTGGN